MTARPDDVTAGPGVAVVIPARNSADTLATAVASALGQDGADVLEVAIAVGPSDDATWEVARRLASQHPRVRVLDNPTGTTPAALNLAVAATTAATVVRLDAHAVLPPGYVRAAVAELDRDERIGNVGGRQVPTADRGFARAVAFAMSSPAGSGGATYRHGTESADVDTVYLGVFRREALEDVGGFDEALLRNQDYELNHRLRQAGWRVRFHPELAVRYRPRSTPGGLWRQYHAYGGWKRHVLRLHPGSLRLRQLAAPVLVLALTVALAVGVAVGSWWLLGTVATVYLLAVAAAALQAAVPEPARATQVALALIVMHLAWGVGFLTGRAGSRTP